MSTYLLRQTSTFLAGLNFLLLVSADGAFAFGLRVTPISGTASEGRGQIGDPLVEGIDATLGEGESLVALFATLQWDLEGGSVLDLVVANESLSIIILPR